MKTIFKIKTYSCNKCGHSQDFKSISLCPSCKLGNLIKETNPNKKFTVIIMGEEDIKDDEDKIERKKDIKQEIQKMKLLEDKSSII